MSTELFSNLEQQKNAISLHDARKYVGHWQKFVTGLYKGQHKHMPHGIFIPMVDLHELVNLQRRIKHIHINGKRTRIYIVGIRAYYCLKSEVLMAIPVSSTDYPVEAILVAVYQTNERVEGSDAEYHHHEDQPTHDLIVRIPSVKDIDEPGDGGDSSIYDITQPCPNLCDEGSPLFNPSGD